jgi:anti-sigma B factor antagonist
MNEGTELGFSAVSREVDEETTVLALSGELDLHSSRQLADALGDTRPQTTTLIVDLAGVGFLDSTALALLTAEANRLRSRGGSVVLVAGSLTIRRVLEVTGLDRLFTVRGSLDAALEALPPRPQPDLVPAA